MTSDTEAPVIPRYPYVHLDVPTDDVELVSSELWEQGAQGIEERDATTIDQGASATVTTLIVSVVDDAAAQAEDFVQDQVEDITEQAQDTLGGIADDLGL